MSITNITYLKDIIPSKYFIWSDYDYITLHFTDIIEIKLFLQELQIDKVYVVTFELIISDLQDIENPPVITLSNPILITKNSNPRLISNFIKNQLIRADINFNLDYDLLMDMKVTGKSNPYILVKYNTINLF